MANPRTYTTVILILYAVLAVAQNTTKTDNPKFCTCNEDLINRRGFPDGFIFGSASAAYQVEGAHNTNGKGPSMWDNFTHTYPDRISDHSTGDVAVDSYHLYKEDVRILKDMGVDAYRFSISWPRILPGGSIRKGVNQDGIDYYNNLINELLLNGIQPWIVMLHLDTSQALEDAYGGFLSSKIVVDFRDFADVLFREFGDRVKHWITINEPWGISYLGYTKGVFAPGRCSEERCLGGDSATEPYIVTHNQLLSHAAIVKLYKAKYQEIQKGKIGIIANTFWFVPYNETNECRGASDRALDFMLGWTMDPVIFGRYPKSMIERVGSRLPKFTKEESEMIKGSFDFIGVNYYSAYYAFNVNNPTTEGYPQDGGYDYVGKKNGIPIGEQGRSGSWYYTYPKGLRELLRYIKVKYNDPLIYVTENGHDEDRNDDVPMYEAMQDHKRKKYIHDHLCCLREAIEKDDVNVRGYFLWSLTDNYEWASGFLVRFGIHYVDFANKSLKRHPKLSALWYKSILAGQGIEKITKSLTMYE